MSPLLQMRLPLLVRPIFQVIFHLVTQLGWTARSVFTEATALGGSLVSDATSIGDEIVTKVTCMFFPSSIQRARGPMLTAVTASYCSNWRPTFH